MSQISIQDISKTYTSQGLTIEALKDINIEIESGSFVCIIGGSGCGKSTLLHTIAGFEHPDSGKVEIGNEEVLQPDIRRQMIFQNYGLFPWLTVAGNIKFALDRRNNLKQNEKSSKIAYYLGMVGLTDFADSYPHQLSGGMKQRVAVARALAAKPDVIFMDEPFGALDAITKMRLQDEIRRICTEQQCTIVMVTHDIDEAIYLADRILVMKPSPGHIYKDIPVNLPHPRQRISPHFLQIRASLLLDLDMAVKIEPDYTI